MTGVLTTLLPGFAGTALPVWVRDQLRAGLGGVCLFAQNISSLGQLRDLTGAIMDANPYAIIAIDEEGGDVTRLFAATGAPFPGNAVLGRLDDLDTTRDTAAAIGWSLRRAGCTSTSLLASTSTPGPTTQSSASAALAATPKVWRGTDGPGSLASSRLAWPQAPNISRGTAIRRRTPMSRYQLSTGRSTSCAGASCCRSPQPSRRGAGW